MKAIWIFMFLFFQASAMDLAITFEQLTLDQTAAETEKIRVEEGPDDSWHFINSFIQAFINPAQVTYSQDQIFFKHYQYSNIAYCATYDEFDEWLHLIAVSKNDLEKNADQILLSSDLQQLTELQKFRVIRPWLQRFLNDDSDCPSVVWKKKYLDALKDQDYTQLSSIAKSIAKYNHTTLMNEINQRRNNLLEKKEVA